MEGTGRFPWACDWTAPAVRLLTSFVLLNFCGFDFPYANTGLKNLSRTMFCLLQMPSFIGLHLFWLPTKLDVDMWRTHEAFGSIGHCPCVLALPLRACMPKKRNKSWCTMHDLPSFASQQQPFSFQDSRVRFRYWAPQANDAPQTWRLKPSRHSVALLFGKRVSSHLIEIYQ